MKLGYFGINTSGTANFFSTICLNSLWKISILMVCNSIPSSLSVLIPGKHNTSPVTACTGYNPAQLTFNTSVSGGQPPYTYQWQLNNAAIPGETLLFYNPPQLTSAGFYAYNCAVTDAAGTVVYTVAKPITIVPDPGVTISGGGGVCLNTPLTLSPVVTNGTGTISYQWQSSADNVAFFPVPGATASTFSPLTNLPGTWFYRVNIYPAVGSCNNAVSPAVAVIVHALPVTSPIYHF
jgi:hypothetical protein